MNIRSKIVQQFERAAQEQDKRLAPLTDNMPLLESGLDSLCFAIIVTRLEDMLGADPFSSDGTLFPVTFGEFVKLYEASLAQSLASPEDGTNSFIDGSARQGAAASEPDLGGRHRL